MTGSTTSTTFVPIGEDQVTRDHTTEMYYGILGFFIFALIAGGLLMYFIHRDTKSMEICKFCGGRLKPYSTKFSICVSCGKRDDEPVIA